MRALFRTGFGFAAARVRDTAATAGFRNFTRAAVQDFSAAVGNSSAARSELGAAPGNAGRGPTLVDAGTAAEQGVVARAAFQDFAATVGYLSALSSDLGARFGFATAIDAARSGGAVFRLRPGSLQIVER
jgi:hypothetical protein